MSDLTGRVLIIARQDTSALRRERAIAALQRRMFRRLYGIAYAKVHDWEEAHSIAAAAFVRALDPASKFDGKKGAAWMVTIASHLAYQRLRDLARDSRHGWRS